MQMMAHWNHSVHLWLVRGVQERLLKPGQKPSLFETFVTFTVSAVWHGLYPFYYVMFFFCALMVEMSKEVYRSRALFSFLPPLASHLLANQLSMLCLNYFGTSITCLTFERGWNFVLGTYGYIYIILILSLTIWKMFGITKKVQNMQKKAVAKEKTT